MKNTAILVDTNVVLDWILKRQDFHQAATQVIGLCISGKITGYLAAHSILNVFYITRKDFSTAQRQMLSKLLCNRFEIIGVNRDLIMEVLDSGSFKDIEDGLQIRCAEVEGLEYIVTRDTSGFKASTVPAILPHMFLEITGVC